LICRRKHSIHPDQIIYPDMKKIFLATLLFIAFKSPAQNPGIISGQFAEKYVGQVMSVFGNVYKTSYDARTHTMFVDFGSKSLAKGVVLTLVSDEKLQANNTRFRDLKGRFITVTGKILRNAKGEISINGDDLKTSISIQQSFAIN
jgi:hypothetical protein